MYYLILIAFILFSYGCGNSGLSDTEAPKITGVSIETNSTCKKAGIDVPCLVKSLSDDPAIVSVRITGSDDTGIAGYYISSADSLVPAPLINIFPAPSSFDDVIKFNLTAGDGVKTIRVLLQDQSGKISDIVTVSVLVISGQTADYKTESIDSKSDFEKGLNIHSLLVDGNGKPHIVYGDNELYSAVSDTSGWIIRKIKDTETESGGSSAGTFTDTAGGIHISYADKDNNLVYAVNSSGSWVFTTVDGSGTLSGNTAIAKGAAGTYISYYDGAMGYLKYAVCTSGCTDPANWGLFIADSAKGTGIYSSIKAGSDGSVHIAYFDNTNRSLKYITIDNQGDKSIPEAVDSTTGIYNAIALDSDNNAHIAYYDGSTGRLKYAANTSGSWMVTEVDEDSSVATYVSIAVDEAGYVHIAYAYFDALSSGLKYASNTSGSWVTAIIDNGNTGLYNRIEIGSDQKIHISYLDSNAKAVEYAVCSSSCTDTSHWKIVRVSSSGDAGRYNSLFRDSTGKIHVSYIGGKDLRYAENSTGEWRSAIIDKIGTPGECSSMAVDSLGTTHISCYDVDKKWLKYAACKADCTVPDNWTSVTIDNGNNNGNLANAGFSYLSLAVDADGGINVSYYDITIRSLKYAYCRADCTDDKDGNNLADNWMKVIIDTNAELEVGQYSSIAVSDTGTKKYISYFDKTNGDLKYASCDSNCTEDSNGDGLAENWIIKTIDEGKYIPSLGSTDSTGLYTSVKADKNGYVHISYFDDTSGDLMYATNKSGTWEKLVVDNYDRAGIYTALTVGADDRVYIAYYRYSSGLTELRYAVCSSYCTTDNVVALFDNPGMFASITTDTNRDIHIVYYDPDTGGLNYTFSK